jgi:hypothetical protein
MRNFPNAVRASADFAEEAPPYRGASAISDQPGCPPAIRKQPMRKPCFILHLEAMPGNYLAPPVQRLRAALKRLKRNYGLRCTRCEPAPAPAQTTEGQQQ